MSDVLDYAVPLLRGLMAGLGLLNIAIWSRAIGFAWVSRDKHPMPVGVTLVGVTTWIMLMSIATFDQIGRLDGPPTWRLPLFVLAVSGGMWSAGHMLDLPVLSRLMGAGVPKDPRKGRRSTKRPADGNG